MFQKTAQWFVDRLVERFLPAIGSFMGSALQRMLILGHAEHHSQLEDQARRYEAAGKPHLAAMIRERAESLNLDEPMPDALDVMERVTSRLPEVGNLPPIGLPDRDAKQQRGRKKGKPVAGNGTSRQSNEDTDE